MVKLTIDSKEIEVAPCTTILQAASKLGIEIPVFCYHPKLSVAGNCRMCLVEVEKSPKPVASCSMPVSEGMVVYTTSEKIKTVRKGILEILLINHPLDCPICDQGGECDLQDITMAYGSVSSRYEFDKRAVTNKYMGPLINTIMTRCIHCSRCVRFANEVAGAPEMGILYRGENAEITSYLEQAITSELSGNMADICPVGALTHKPDAFKKRSWELKKTPSIDVLDALGSHVFVETRQERVIRITPREFEPINEVWLSDKGRYACDGLSHQRLETPYIKKDGKLHPVNWKEAFEVIASKIKQLLPSQMAALAGDLADCESMFALKLLMNKMGSTNTESRLEGQNFDVERRTSYLFNSTLEGVNQADLILIIGSNPKWEAPLLNARIFKSVRNSKATVGVMGLPYDLGYKYDHLGEGALELKELLSGKHSFCEKLKSSKRPMVILGPSVYRRRDASTIVDLVQQLCESYAVFQEDWNGFNVLHTKASSVGALDLGFVPEKKTTDMTTLLRDIQQDAIKLVYLLGVDSLSKEDLKDAFVIYQGHHGDVGAHSADVVLPGLSYTEKTATYVNVEGRVQSTTACAKAQGQAKEDWKILRALSDVLGQTLPFNTLEALREQMTAQHPTFQEYGAVSFRTYEKQTDFTPESLSQLPFEDTIPNYYMTDVISKNSATMAACVREILKQERAA